MRKIVLLWVLFISGQSFAQGASDWHLEKMPVDLETDYALSALPPHLRQDATVYLLDPLKGYYVGHQGSNGYIAFVSRTEWEWADFRQDFAVAISYDAEGARAVFPVYADVAAMRATGKFQPGQIKDSVESRLRSGVYQAFAKPGISYMLAPIVRLYPGGPDVKEPITICMPHYMLYAPYLLNENTRYKEGTDGFIFGNPDNAVLGDGKGPYNYIIIPATNAEKAIIVADGADLIKRLAAYKDYFRIDPGAGGEHHHSGATNN
jgi:hypothetical protein